jgi:hypothetical protein
MISNTTPARTFSELGTVQQPKCKRCGSLTTRQGPGAGPHHARLNCAECGSFIKWLAKPSSHGDGIGYDGVVHAVEIPV